MSAGVGFALLSMLSAGVLDVLFGRYITGRKLGGTYLIAVGCFILLGQIGALFGAGIAFAWNGNEAIWGITAGVVLVVANALLIESLARVYVSLGSTIYRLNTIAVVLFAAFFLGEAPTPLKLGGIALGIVAVFLLYRHGARSGAERLLAAGVTLAIAAALLRAVFGVMSKHGLAHGGEPFVFLIYIGAGWTLGALLYAVVRRDQGAAAAGVLKYALASGVLICLVASFLLLGLAHGEASIVIPIANMSFIVAMLVSVAAGMEPFTTRKFLAVICAAGAIALLTNAQA